MVVIASFQHCPFLAFVFKRNCDKWSVFRSDDFSPNYAVLDLSALRVMPEINEWHLTGCTNFPYKVYDKTKVQRREGKMRYKDSTHLTQNILQFCHLHTIYMDDATSSIQLFLVCQFIPKKMIACWNCVFPYCVFFLSTIDFNCIRHLPCCNFCYAQLHANLSADSSPHLFFFRFCCGSCLSNSPIHLSISNNILREDAIDC